MPRNEKVIYENNEAGPGVQKNKTDGRRIFVEFSKLGNLWIGLLGAAAGAILCGALLTEFDSALHDRWAMVAVATVGAFIFVFIANIAHVAAGPFKRNRRAVRVRH